VDENEIRKATSSKPALSSNYYYPLSDPTPPDCQVKEQTPNQKEAINKFFESAIKRGVLNGTIPSIIVDSAATSNVGATRDQSSFVPTGRSSNKIFQLPNGTQTAADSISELPFDIGQLVKDIHLIPSITKSSLLSIPKTADAGYITVFDDQEINIYDARDTKILITMTSNFTRLIQQNSKTMARPTGQRRHSLCNAEQMPQHHLLQKLKYGRGVKENNFQQSNWMIPKEIKQRQSIYHGIV
jgi:hypothetical protein